MLSDFQIENFSRTLPSSEDPGLNSLIEKINETARFLQAKARAAEQARAMENTIIETMATGLVVQDENGAIEKFNPAALSLLGLTESQLKESSAFGSKWGALKEDGSPLLEDEHPALAALKTGKPVRDMAMGFTLGNGEERWIRINAAPLESASGRRVVSTFFDITAVVKAEKEMDHIFGHSMDLMCIASTDGTFKRVSPSFTKMLGWEERELLFQPFANFIHPEDLESTGKIVETLAVGVPLIGFENRYRAKDGGYRLISWMCEPDPKTGLLYAIGRDVTALRESEYRNNQILAAIDQTAIVAFTDTKGKITRVNDNFCKITGYSREELIGQDHRLINSGQHPKSFFSRMWADLRAGKTWTADIENKTKSGDHYFVRSVISPIRNVEGEIEQFIAIRFDVTDQKKFERELLYSLEFNEAIRRNAKFSIITTDIDGIITGFNEEAERILGFSADELIGKQTPAAFHDPSEVVAVAKLLSKEFNTNVPAGFETFVFKARQNKGNSDERRWTYIRKDGTRVQVQLNVTGLYDSKGQLNGFMGIAKDLTEELALHSELENERSKSIRNSKLASLGEMSAGIAHEINNPLAIISGSAGLLAKFANNPEKLASKVETIQKSCERIARIVTSLRKFSRTGDKSNLQRNKISKIAREATVLTEAKSKRHSVPVTLDCSSESQILCDDVEIEQVLVNLINNAIDAVKRVPEKWVKVALFDDADSVVLRISDSGSGIPNNIRSKLFQPFFTTKKVGEGTGLGLSITKGILDEHNATISILANSPNTCFEIRLPRAEAADIVQCG